MNIKDILHVRNIQVTQLHNAEGGDDMGGLGSEHKIINSLELRTESVKMRIHDAPNQ